MGIAKQLIGAGDGDPLVTTLYLLVQSSTSLRICTHSMIQRMPLAGQFRLDDFHVFTDGPSGGVQCAKYFRTTWLSKVPWSQMIVKKFLDRRTWEEARMSGDQIFKLVGERRLH